MLDRTEPISESATRLLLERLRLDPVLMLALLAVALVSAATLYSASDQQQAVTLRQLTRFGLASLGMIAIARFGVHRLYLWTPVLYLASLAMLFAVMLLGTEGKGAQRWLNLGLFSFQPSELMKIAMPMMIAFFFAERRLPPTAQSLIIAFVLVLVPVLLIYQQPDLGTALMIGASGLLVIFMAGLPWRAIFLLLAGLISLVPVVWHFMHDYQRNRVITFLNPESDPLGAGYHIIQSKIALGSGGFYGKGWLQGTQTQLNFLPEQTTDFIFSVYGEEFGMLGVLVLFGLYLVLVLRGLFIAWNAQDTFGRLLAAGISMNFFLYFFVNIGMVSGIVPVVGVPLPLFSYGGSSMVTLMAGFGILMAIKSERRLLTK
ncbi:MAG: rod shape-determining protein RodA [Thiotrichales bacterium]